MLPMWEGLNIQLHSFLLPFHLFPEVCEKWSLVWSGAGCWKTSYRPVMRTWFHSPPGLERARGREDRGRQVLKERGGEDPTFKSQGSVWTHRQQKQHLFWARGDGQSSFAYLHYLASIFYNRDYEIYISYLMLKWNPHHLALNWHFGESSKKNIQFLCIHI